MRRRLTLALAAAAALLAGCESMSERQCQRADWYERGRFDGNMGEPESRLQDHRQACAKAGIVPDEVRWRQGWVEAVRGYCTPRWAWQMGTENRSYKGACRDFDEAVFLRWYQAGKDVYKTTSERDEKQREIERLEKELQKAQKEEDRRALRQRIRRLDEEQARLRRLLDAQMSGAPR
jgi:hypothetical protein